MLEAPPFLIPGIRQALMPGITVTQLQSTLAAHRRSVRRKNESAFVERMNLTSCEFTALV